MAHTPGPWYVNQTYVRVDVFDKDRGPVQICKLLWPTELRSAEETEANYKLISAAPELLDALHRTRLALIGYTHKTDEVEDAIFEADKAISKAQGQS